MRALRIVSYSSLMLMVLLGACTSGTGVSIKEKGETIEITAKDLSAKASKMGTEKGAFILFTANTVPYPEALKYLDAMIIVMSKEDADKLKAQYGNFVDNANKGHAIARKSIRYLNLIALDKDTQKKIKKLIELNSLRLYPLINLSMTEIRVTDLSYKKSKLLLNGVSQLQYLVSKLDILENNHHL
jgi:hypothetical protein